MNSTWPVCLGSPPTHTLSRPLTPPPPPFIQRVHNPPPPPPRPKPPFPTPICRPTLERTPTRPPALERAGHRRSCTRTCHLLPSRALPCHPPPRLHLNSPPPLPGPRLCP